MLRAKIFYYGYYMAPAEIIVAVVVAVVVISTYVYIFGFPFFQSGGAGGAGGSYVNLDGANFQVGGCGCTGGGVSIQTGGCREGSQLGVASFLVGADSVAVGSADSSISGAGAGPAVASGEIEAFDSVENFAQI